MNHSTLEWISFSDFSALRWGQHCICSSNTKHFCFWKKIQILQILQISWFSNYLHSTDLPELRIFAFSMSQSVFRDFFVTILFVCSIDFNLNSNILIAAVGDLVKRSAVLFIMPGNDTILWSHPWSFDLSQ